MMTKKRCCQDNFSTLSWKIRCLCITSSIFTSLCVILLLIYYIILRDDIIPRQGAMFLSQLEDIWRSNCAEISDKNKFDCYPELEEIDENVCLNRGCCWQNSTKRTPRCYYPNNYGYRVLKQDNFHNGFETLLTRLPSPSRYGDDIHHVTIHVEMQTSTRLRIKFYDTKNKRYEVPLPQVPVESFLNEDRSTIPLYSIAYNLDEVPYGIKIRRAGTDNLIFDMVGHSFTFAHQFLQITVKLPSSDVYGFGEHLHGTYRHNLEWKVWSMFSSDDSEQEDGNKPGVHPVYMCLESDGKAHGVLLLNSNAMEVQLSPTPAVTFRTIGGVLDFYLFLGPTPEEVVKQYTEAVGRPAMPPYWALGYHLIQKDFDFGELQAKLKKMRAKDISHDVLGINIESHKYSSNDLSNLIIDLEKHNQKFLLLISPGVSTAQKEYDHFYHSGLEQGLFINSTWGGPLISKGMFGNVVFPDFGNSLTQNWWQDRIQNLNGVIPFDGLWLINNVPVNYANESEKHCYPDILNKPPFKPRISKEFLYEDTICMDAIQYWKEKQHLHYNLHNLYGHSMVTTTHSGMKSFSSHRRTITTQSTFAGSGKFAGHPISYTLKEWSDMKSIIPVLLEFNLFGIPDVGLDICTSESNIDKDDKELCIRQIQLGVFYPLAFSYLVEDKRKGLSSDADVDYVTRQALWRRYELLPYLYTLFHYAHVYGSTVVRPLFHEFPRDPVTPHLDQQFMWGNALLVSPALEKGINTITAYFPKGVWYDYYSGRKYTSLNGEWIELSASLHLISRPINLHVRGGHIIPTQQAANTTHTSRRNPMGLVVALNSLDRAEDTLFWDDGQLKESYELGQYIIVKFNVSKNVLCVHGERNKKIFRSNFFEVYFQFVRVMGLVLKPRKVTIDSSYILTKKQYRWDSEYKVLHLQHILVPLTRTTYIEWFL